MLELDRLAPSAVGDTAFSTWRAAYLRRSASPEAPLALARTNTEIEIRNILPGIRVLTLILHHVGDLDIDVGGAGPWQRIFLGRGTSSYRVMTTLDLSATRKRF